jgi:hypothetical protein
MGCSMKAKILFAVTALSLMTAAHSQTLCVFDLSGTGGDVYSNMRDYALAARAWDVDFKLEAYTNEPLAIKEFKSGKCDAVAIPGISTKEFNNFVGSIDAVGALSDLASVKIAMALMANPKLAPDMVNGNYEVAGVGFLGTIYLMVKDRSVNTLQRMTGKTFGVLSYDKSDLILVDKLGAIPVGMEISDFGTKFNSGKIDIAPLLPLMFKPFELSKGLGNQGAILRFPVLQFTGDVILHKDKFPDGYGQKSRKWFAGRIDRDLATANKTEAGIPAKYWEDMPSNNLNAYERVLREARISLTHQGTFDKKMMVLLKKVRCVENPSNFECKLTDE